MNRVALTLFLALLSLNATVGYGYAQSTPAAINAADIVAADKLAATAFTIGDIQTALQSWNHVDKPVVNEVLQNGNVAFDSWTVAVANAFHPGQMMTYAQWRTTQLRLFATGIYSNVGIDIEPAPKADQYNPIILTSKKTNDFANVAFGAVRGAPLKTAYFDEWDISHSGISVNSSYRWDYNRRRGEVQLHVPIPVPGILFMNATGLWRSERWDLTRVLQTDAGANDRFQYDSTGVRMEIHYIPQYRYDFGGGYEYTNRAASGGLPALLTDGRNSGKLLFQGNLRLADGRYQNRIHIEGFIARKNILGDLNDSAGTVEVNNQYTISNFTRTVFKWTFKGGTSRGQLPVEDYFTLGVDTNAGNLLRAHPSARSGHYGNSPMGTSFALSNMEIERRVAVLPLFNTLNIPYLELKALAFADGGKTFDRANVFKEGTLYVDTGAGLKFETPTNSLNLIYGKSLRDGRNTFSAYIEKRW